MACTTSSWKAFWAACSRGASRARVSGTSPVPLEVACTIMSARPARTCSQRLGIRV